MSVLTLSRYTPLERDDGIPWTAARIQEAPSATGAWTQIDQITLTPQDTDPANPATRDLTTIHATLTEGWYRVIWVDGSGGTSSPTPPVQNLSDQAGGVRPSVTEIASLLRARTKITGGREEGTFNTKTRPTASEVEALIDHAVDEVEGKVQPVDTSLPVWAQPGDAYNAPGSPYERRMRRAIALYAAILVELSYFPEQVRQDQSPVSIYQQLFYERIRSLIAEGEIGRPGGMGEDGSGGGDSPADAAYSFPADTGGLVGWQSRW